MRTLVPFKCKFPSPCKRILQNFKLRLRKPLSIRGLQSRHSSHQTGKTLQRKRFTKIISIFSCFRPSGDMDRVMKLKSFSSADYSRAPLPSPITPAYVRLTAANKKEVSAQQDVEDACRSFENYLVEMIVEEGRMRDLTDVEELLDSWKNLKCPVFIDVVCRFYVELCKDLFSNSCENVCPPKRVS